MMRRFASLLVTTAVVAAVPAFAQDTAFGGQSGPDLSIEAIEPDDAAIDIGLAGQQSADIARYLLANGANSAQLSPDGQTIVFSWSITGQPELWLMPATGGQPRQLTFRTGPDFFRWTPDGTGIVYGADRDGNEQEGYFWISADGLNERAILPAAAGDFRVFGDFAADGSFVYSSTLRNGSDFDLYRADLAGNIELIYEGSFDTTARSLSPDGRFAVVTQSVGEDADTLHLLDLASGELITLGAPPVAERANHSLGGFAWSPLSPALVYSTNAGREFGALTEYLVSSGETMTYHAPDANVGDIAFCGAGGEYLVWTESRDGFETLGMWHLASGQPAAAPALPEGDYSVDCEGEIALVRVSNWQTPGDLFTFIPGQAQAARVFASNMAGVDPATLVRPQVVRYPARDGVELQGLLYLPAGAGTGADAPPVVFEVHGGPSSLAGPGWNAVTQYHVSRGLAVFQPNVRGSTGLGRTYSTLDDRELRLDSVRDLVDLLDALAADGLVDGDRAAVMGGSYGGYMVNAVLSEYPDAFVAGAARFGVGNWVTALEVASPALKASDRIEYGDITEQRWRDFYGAMSPVFRADQIRVPVLYSHGAMDPRIDIAETEVMVNALRANGVRADFVRLPDEGHGWRKLGNQLFYYRREAQFLEEVLGLAN